MTSLSRFLSLLLCFTALIMSAPPTHSQERAMTQPSASSSDTVLSKAEIEAAAQRRVVFAHQSVGFNILDGVSKLAAEQGVSLNIVETRQPPAEGAGVFHFRVGRNGAPDSKISDYAGVVGAAGFPAADVALVKLCYVDFSADTDAAAVAKTYADALEGLQKAHPATRFVAMTAPLTTLQTGPKAWLKGALGRSTGRAENARRHQFNEVLRKQFGPDRVFDLARIESGGATGNSAPSLRPELTDDGGHLNGEGQRLVAIAFLKLLAAKGN